MATSIRLVQNVFPDLVRSVSNFMASPKYWKEAVWVSPRYFVHVQKGGKHCFGLAKYCAYKDVSLETYVTVKALRSKLRGGKNRRHIKRLTKQKGIPLTQANNATYKAFEHWFAKILPHYELSLIRIISLGKVADMD